MLTQRSFLLSLLRFNWQGLISSGTSVYGAAVAFLFAVLPPSVPHILVFSLAGLATFGSCIGFFVQTFRPEMIATVSDQTAGTLLASGAAAAAAPVVEQATQEIVKDVPAEVAPVVASLADRATEELLAEVYRRTGGKP